jgi:hypothetical protein
MKQQIQVISKSHHGLLYVESLTPDEGGGIARSQGQDRRHTRETACCD